jgi:hypothetical protein
MDAMVAYHVPYLARFEALVLLFHFGVSHLSSNLIAAFCLPRRALKIALRRSKNSLVLTKNPQRLIFLDPIYVKSKSRYVKKAKQMCPAFSIAGILFLNEVNIYLCRT